MLRTALSALLLVLVLAACSADAGAVSSSRAVVPIPTPTTEPTPTPTLTAEPTPEPAAAPESHAHHGGETAGQAGIGTAQGLPTADELIAATAMHLEQWRDVAAAEAAGYRSLGDGFTGWEHLIHPDWAADEVILDPSRPESLVYRVTDGERELVSAMYLLPPDATMDDVPDLGDERAIWHIHDNLCFDEEGRLAGIFMDGTCLFGGEHRVTPPMLHVWIVDHPCGPFAAIEGHGERCDADHDH